MVDRILGARVRAGVSRWLHSARPQVCEDVAAWARSRGIEVREIHPAIGAIPWPEGEFGERIAWQIPDSRVDLERPQVLTCLTGASVRGVHGLVRLPDGAVLLQGNWLPRLLTSHPDYGRRLPRRRREMRGDWYSLSSYWSTEYYHWFHEVIPRLHGALPYLPEGTRFLTGCEPRAFQVDSLKALGVDADRLEWARGAEDCVPERLWFATPMGNPYATNGGVLRELRARFRSAVGAGSGIGGRRLYISRSNASARRVIDEESLTGALTDRGFEVVRPERAAWSDQARLFGGASCVVAPHGAGLVNMIAMEEGGAVVELFDREHLRPFYWIMTQQLGLRYGWVAGDPVGDHPTDPDMRLETDAVLSVVDAALSGNDMKLAA
jgi:capsular polysaccharide biosynthesis protein